MEQTIREIAPPSALTPYVATLGYTEIPLSELTVSWTQLQPNLWRLALEGTLTREIRVGSFEVRVTPAFQPDFHWAPHLTPEDGYVMDMHVFRTPAIIACGQQRSLAVLPDVEKLCQPYANRVFMDMDAHTETYVIGLTTTAVREHE